MPAQEQQIMELVSGSHSIGQNLYHLEWCPKYRYNMFRQEDNKNLCEKILREFAQKTVHQNHIDECDAGSYPLKYQATNFLLF